MIRGVLEGIRTRIATYAPESGFMRPVFTLLSGSALAQAIGYLARPILTRLFPPEAFGILALFMSVCGVFLTVASGGYLEALMLPKNSARATNLLPITVGIAVLVACLSLLLIPWRGALSTFLGDPNLAAWIVLVPLTILATGILNVATVWTTRIDQFGAVSISRIGRRSVTALSQTAAGFAGWGAGGLVGGYLAGHLLAAFGLTGYLLRRLGRELWHHINLRQIHASLRRYAAFLLFSTPAAMLNKLTGLLPILVLGSFFGSETVGYYSIAYGSIALPLGLMSSSISQVYYARGTRAAREDRLDTVTSQVLRTLFQWNLFPALVVVIAGPDLFAIVFGETWRVAGEYGRYLAPWILMSTTASPLTRLFDILERQRMDLIFSLVMFPVMAGALITGGLLDAPFQAVVVIGGVGLVLRTAHVVWTLSVTEQPLAPFGRHLGMNLLLAAPFLAIIGVVHALTGPVWTLVTGIAVGMVFLALVIARSDELTGPAMPIDER